MPRDWSRLDDSFSDLSDHLESHGHNDEECDGAGSKDAVYDAGNDMQR
jgi:hypothetical protein